MSQIYILSSLVEFYKFIKSSLTEYHALFFIEYIHDDTICFKEITPENYEVELTNMRERNLNFYISTMPLNSYKNFYQEGIYPFVIEGKGGRLTSTSLEIITLRIVAKKPDITIQKVFDVIKKTLRSDSSVVKGLTDKSRFHKNIYVFPGLKSGLNFVFDIFLDIKI